MIINPRGKILQISRRSVLQDIVAATSLSAAFASSVSAEAIDVGAIAEEAYIWGLPLWLQEKYLERSRQAQTPMNRFSLSSQLARPEDRNIGPNVDTLYGYAWLDLEAEPVVLYVPDTDDRYYCIQFIDAYSNSFQYVGRRVTGTKEGRYVIACPDWNGRLPEGAVRFNAPTKRVLALARTLVRGEADLPRARAIQNQFTLTPLSLLGKPAQPSLSVVSAIGVFPFLRPGEQGAQYLDDLGRYLRADPPPHRENAPLAHFAAAKIGPAFLPSQSAQHAEYANAITAADQRVQAADYSSRVNGWKVNYGVTPFIADRLQRAAANRLGPGVHVAEEALYFVANADSKGQPFTGKSRYRLRFAAGQLPPVDAFWSLILYGSDFFLYQNPLNRYSISDRTEGLVHQADGSLEILLQHTRPESGAGNWLPAPDGNFQLVLRTYQPKPEVLRREWKPPLVEAVA